MLILNCTIGKDAKITKKTKHRNWKFRKLHTTTAWNLVLPNKFLDGEVWAKSSIVNTNSSILKRENIFYKVVSKEKPFILADQKTYPNNHGNCCGPMHFLLQSNTDRKHLSNYYYQCETNFLLQCLSNCVQCHNAIAFRGTFPDGCDIWDEAWFTGEHFYSEHNLFFLRNHLYLG